MMTDGMQRDEIGKKTEGPLPAYCPVCHARDVTFRFKKENLRGFRCQACGLVFLWPLPNRESHAGMYHRLGSDYYLGEDKMALDEGAVYEERLALLEPYRGASRLLDVGCSTGAFLSSARRKGWLVRGVELSLPAAQYASEVRKLDVFCGALAEARYPDGSFDVVNLWAVLEHVLNPVELISEIGRVLRPGGLLVFCVPNFDSLPIRLLGVRYRYICGGHLFYFTEKSVRFMLAQCGFLPVKISSEYFSPFTLAEDFWGCRPETAKTEKKEKAAVSLLRNRPSVNWALKWGWKSAMAAIRRWGLGEELRCLAVKNRKK